MRKLLVFGLVILLFTSCNQQEARYTQQSPEIDTYKGVINAYENQDWETMVTFYADTAKIMNNVKEKNAQTLQQLIAQNKEDAKLFSSWDFVDDESEYEMVVTDDGETWVNFWGLWQGTLKENNKVYEIPTHITARFQNGKIIREAGYWDVSEITQALQQIQANKNEMEKDAENNEVSSGN